MPHSSRFAPMPNSLIRPLALAIALTAVSSAAWAHFLWIEPAAARALRSQSPSAFVLKGKVDATDSIVAQQARITERKLGEKTTRPLGQRAMRSIPDWGERSAVLALDVLPAGKP